MIIYLASPYSHPDKWVREQNFRKVTKIAAQMNAQGEIVISPITYGHTLVMFHEMPTDWEFWQNFCFTLLVKCDKILVCKMPGWESSRGVAEEISIARDHGIQIEYLEYEESLIT
jgi:hypothetical protein